MQLRQARPEDAAALALLIDLAGEGLPHHLWAEQAEPGMEPILIGVERAAGDSGGFSYRNAHVLEIDDQVAAMLLGYRLDDPYQLPQPDQCPAVVWPLLELEAQAPGSWYINAVATFEAYRGQGLASELMTLAGQLAQQSGAVEASLIVAEQNRNALALYRNLGYEVRERQPLIAWPNGPHGGDWLLMTRGLTASKS